MHRRVRITYVDDTPHVAVEAQPGHDYLLLSLQLGLFQPPDDCHITATNEPIADATATIEWASHERISILFSKIFFLLLKDYRDRFIL